MKTLTHKNFSVLTAFSTKSAHLRQFHIISRFPSYCRCRILFPINKSLYKFLFNSKIILFQLPRIKIYGSKVLLVLLVYSLASETNPFQWQVLFIERKEKKIGKRKNLQNMHGNALGKD